VIQRRALGAIGIVVVAVAATVLVFAVPGSTARPYVVLVFALVCPGLAVVRLFRLDDPLLELAIAIAVSIGVELMVSTAMVYLGLWSPKTLFTALVCVSIGGAAAELARARQQAEAQT
jgi:CBS-domain-containing membrane protein